MARQKRTHGYTERLGVALAQGPRPMSVRLLAQELGGDKEAGTPGRYPRLRGTSYGGVRQYSEGKVQNPRVELLRAMAEVLGVRGEWLAFGVGPMTEEEALLRAQTGVVADSRGSTPSGDITPDPADLEKAFLEGLPALARAGATSWHSIADLHSDYVSALFRDGGLARLGLAEFSAKRAQDPGDESKRDRDFAALVSAQTQAQVDAARRVAQMVGVGAQAAGVDLLTRWSWDIDKYIQLTAQALGMLFRPSTPREMRADPEGAHRSSLIHQEDK